MSVSAWRSPWVSRRSSSAAAVQLLRLVHAVQFGSVMARFDRADDRVQVPRAAHVGVRWTSSRSMGSAAA